MDPPNIDQLRIEFEREKWREELRLREREIAIQERQQQSHEEELRLKGREQDRSRWTNPLVLALLVAAVAAFGNAIVAWLNAYEQQRADLAKSEQARLLNESKSEADRILEVVKTADPDKAATNLKFLLDTGLIQSLKKERIEAYLKDRKTGEGVALPAPGISPVMCTDLGEAIRTHLIDVSDVKKILQHLGLYKGAINSECDGAFFQAVAGFQKTQNMVQDGLVGAETFAKLKEAWPEYFGK